VSRLFAYAKNALILRPFPVPARVAPRAREPGFFRSPRIPPTRFRASRSNTPAGAQSTGRNRAFRRP